jgi:hypothetical protein
MKFLSKLLAGLKAPDSNLGKHKLALSHLAVTEFVEGTMSDQELLTRLMAGFIIVPLAEEPIMEGDCIKVWTPAIITKADGSQWQLVFTSSEANTEFAIQNNYRFELLTGTEWVIRQLPPGRGLIFNIGLAHHFEWTAEGISRIKFDVLGQQKRWS